MEPSAADARREEVHRWQQYYNMRPRDDSRLTELYATGQCTWSAHEVARELVATHFVFTETFYGELIEEFMRRVASCLRETYSLSWNATWDIVRAYAPIALKLLSVQSMGVRIPVKLSAE